METIIKIFRTSWGILKQYSTVGAAGLLDIQTVGGPLLLPVHHGVVGGVETAGGHDVNLLEITGLKAAINWTFICPAKLSVGDIQYKFKF